MTLLIKFGFGSRQTIRVLLVAIRLLSGDHHELALGIIGILVPFCANRSK